jgi:hypothetical protein
MRDDDLFTRLSSLAARQASKLLRLDELLSGARTRYAELSDDAARAVTRWEWSSSLPRYELDPLYFLDDSSRRGAGSKKRPASTKHRHLYGFDDAGRLRVERNHTEFDDQLYEQFFLYGDDEITTLLFDYGVEKNPIRAAVLTLTATLPSTVASRARHGGHVQVFETSDGLIRYAYEQFMPDGREAFGNLSKLEYPDSETVKRWMLEANGEWVLSFSGSRNRYNTLPLPE